LNAAIGFEVMAVKWSIIALRNGIMTVGEEGKKHI
jgi:hypothetical protein